MSNAGAGTTGRTRIIVVAVVVLLVLAAGLAVAKLTGSGDGGGNGGKPGASPTSAGSSPSSQPTNAKPTDAPSPGQAVGSGGASPGATPSSGSPRAGAGPVRVSFDRSARPTKDLRVSVTRVDKVRSQAGLPGETGRPALRITVRVANLTNRVVPIGDALTNVYYGRGRTPASLVSRPGGKPFPAQVRPGSSVSGVFVYNVPPEARNRVVLEVIVDAKDRTVEFSGNCSTRC